MHQKADFVVFDIGGQGCAVPLHSVQRILRAAAVTPVPESPEGLLGVLDLHGDLVPVYDLRSFLGHPDKALCASDRFIIVHDGVGLVGLRADEVQRIGPLNLQSNRSCESLFQQHAGPFCQVAKWGEKTVLVVEPHGLSRKPEPLVRGVKTSDGNVIDMTPGAGFSHVRPTIEGQGEAWPEAVSLSHR